MENVNIIKKRILDSFLSRDIFTEKVSQIQIRTRCPWCGDSHKNLRTGHLYLRINPDDNLPIVYNCFKCPASGVLKYNDLELFGIEDIELKSGMQYINRNADKFNANNVEFKDIHFDFKIPDVYDKYKIEYIENRLGLKFSDEQLKDMKVITSLKRFLIDNGIDEITCKPNMANLVERQYIGFLSNNGAYILFRDITDKHEIRWYKYPITKESQGQRIFYSMASSIDLYTLDRITINLSEGVMDCVSIVHNINDGNSENILNIAICGKFYTNTIKYLINTGFVGSNIIINIYADNDKTNDTSIGYYRKIFKNISHLFGEMNVFYNLKYKDCGVPKSKILLQKYKI